MYTPWRNNFKNRSLFNDNSNGEGEETWNTAASETTVPLSVIPKKTVAI